MAKYLVYLKNQLSLITIYRFEMFTRWFMNLFSALSYYFLWLLTSPTPSQAQKLLSYYILYWGIINNFTSGKVANFMGRDIHSGEINNYLIKPINYPLLVVLRSLTPILVRIVSPVILIFIASLFFPAIFQPVSFLNLILFVIFLSIGFVIWNLMVLTIGSIAFFGTEVQSLTTVFDLIINLLRGAYIPAFLFPAVLSKTLSFTFLPLLAAFPIRLYQERVDFPTIIFELAVSAFWLAAFFAIAKKVYQLGLKSYEAQGG